jgi:hypothetical protein
MHWKGLRLLSSSRAQETSCCTNFNNLCSELHLGILLLLASVVSLQYLVGSYGYSCTISVCPRAISVLQISPYSLLMFDSSSSCHNTCVSQNRVPIFIPLLYFSSIIRVFINSPLEKSQSPNLTSLEKSLLHQILEHTEPNCSPCAVILLVFNRFITNYYIYENSTVWIILPLSKFSGKIGEVTLVPLKTQSPRQNFSGHIYPSYCLFVYTIIC